MSTIAKHAIHRDEMDRARNERRFSNTGMVHLMDPVRIEEPRTMRPDRRMPSFRERDKPAVAHRRGEQKKSARQGRKQRGRSGRRRGELGGEEERTAEDAEDAGEKTGSGARREEKRRDMRDEPRDAHALG